MIFYVKNCDEKSLKIFLQLFSFIMKSLFNGIVILGVTKDYILNHFLCLWLSGLSILSIIRI